MILHPYARGCPWVDDLTDFSGTITTGGTVQQLLPQQMGRTAFYFENTSSANLTLYIGPPPVTVGLTNGVVTSVTVADNGSGWLFAPQVVIKGGIWTGNYMQSPGSPNVLTGTGIFPGRVAKVHVPISAGALGAFVIDDGGAGYGVNPQAFLVNPWPLGGGGAGTPSATAGLIITANGTFTLESTFCPTSAINVFGGTTGQAFVCKVALT